MWPQIVACWLVNCYNFRFQSSIRRLQEMTSSSAYKILRIGWTNCFATPRWHIQGDPQGRWIPGRNRFVVVHMQFQSTTHSSGMISQIAPLKWNGETNLRKTCKSDCIFEFLCYFPRGHLIEKKLPLIAPDWALKSCEWFPRGGREACTQRRGENEKLLCE